MPSRAATPGHRRSRRFRVRVSRFLPLTPAWWTNISARALTHTKNDATCASHLRYASKTGLRWQRGRASAGLAAGPRAPAPAIAAQRAVLTRPLVSAQR
jgi:hypothetical protein